MITPPTVLMGMIEQVAEDDFPFATVIKKIDGSLRFT